jgi:Zn-dependent M16 (insulinase) family peptidase
MGRVYHAWLYDGDPLVGLNFSGVIETIRKKWAHNTHLFQEVVQKWFLDNSHRLLSIMEPSRTYSEERETAFRKKMVDLKASLSPKALEDIRSEAASLRRKQIEPDPPEAIATLPKLTLADIPRVIEIIPTVKTRIADIPAMKHEIFANGIAYLDLAFDVSDVPENLQPYLPLLGKLTTGMGGAGLNYAEMAKRKTLKSGGLGYHLATGMTIDGKGNWQKMIFSIKALHRNIDEAVKIVVDILAKGDLSDESRIRDLIAESKNALHSAVVPSGHSFARRTAAAALSVPAYRDEQWGGRTQLQLLKRISGEFKDRARDLREKFALLRNMIFRKQRLMLNLTGDSEGLSLLAEATNESINRLEKGEYPGPASTPALRRVYAGVTIPAQVCYVAKVIPAPMYSEPLSASLLVLARELSSGYLYKRIRVQGGAYGGMSLYDATNGNFSLLSYRDPNLVETLKTYDNAVDFVSQNKFANEALEKAIIGTIGSLDKPMDPRTKGYTAMIRELAGLTDEDRQKFRNHVLESSPDSLMEAANRYLKQGVKSEAIAVYASAERLEQANKVLASKLDITPLV